MLNIDTKYWQAVDISQLPAIDGYFKTISELLKGYKWYLGFGTALGLYRDKGIIPGDTDIDVNVLVDRDIEPVLKAFKRLYSDIRTVSNTNYQQLALQASDGLIIDISFFYKEGDEWITRHEEGNYIDKVEVIGNLQMLDTKFGKLPVPEKIEDYLVSRYGDWQTPKYGLTTSSIRN